MLLHRRIYVIIVFLLSCTKAFSQHYNFITYNAEDGLPQSQVFGICQSADRQLWLSTLGGISRFNGKTFTNYTVAEGLAASYPLHFILDNQQRIWAINNTRLNLIENNIIFNFELPEKVVNGRARLGITGDNVLWCVINGHLYSFQNKKFQKATLEGIPNKNLFALLKGHGSDLYLMAARRTLYKYVHQQWKPFALLNEVDSSDRIRSVHFDSTGTIWIITSKELYRKTSNNPAVLWAKFPDSLNTLNSLTSDKKGNIWVAAQSGIYKLNPDKSIIYLNAGNGFSNAQVNDIITDQEDNIWMATDGDGLVRFAGGLFTSLDGTDADLRQKVQVLLRNQQNQLLFGNHGQDFSRYENGQRKYLLRNTALWQQQINCAYADGSGNIWIGTGGAGLWRMENDRLYDHLLGELSVYYVMEDRNKMYAATSEGIFELNARTAIRNPAVKEFTSSLMAVGKDSILAALTYGVALVRDSSRIDYPFPQNLQSTMVTGFERKGGKIFIATIGGGIFVWNREKDSFKQLTVSSGLASNIVYSLKFDNEGTLWVGTGNGMSKIHSSDQFEHVTIHSYGKEQGLKALECNKDAIAVMPDNRVWFGTVKGLYCYNPGEETSKLISPQVTLQSIKVFSKPIVSSEPDQPGNTASSSFPANLELSFRNNHITFEFGAISYSYGNIRYSYYLEGMENNFSQTGINEFVTYPSLPPAHYIFHVKAVDESGQQLGQVASYAFTIVPAFYQTTWFRLLIAAVCVGLLVILYSIVKKYRDRQKRLIEILRAEEQRKIRKKTAQDFHDEMGNKLARITVLSDILKTKIPANEETQGLAKKIQDNVAWLYQGTKDIIWSLNPENDNLAFLMKHVSDFGVDLFIDTDIEFEPIDIKPAFQQHYLPMDYARNVIMICKEAFTNILKHSQATAVSARANLLPNHRLQLLISDNGKGFSTTQTSQGNGLNNIRQRASNLGANLQIVSAPGRGTQIVLEFAIPITENEKNKS